MVHIAFCRNPNNGAVFKSAHLAPTYWKLTANIETKKGAYIAVSPFRIWCQWSDSNRHALWAPDFESGASTNSATLAMGAHSNDLNSPVKH